MAITLTAILTWANWPNTSLPAGSKADRIIVRKAKRTLTLEHRGQPLVVYRISLGRSPVGKKWRQGDSKTPEGIYRIVDHKEDSTCHRALRISYPTKRDTSRASQMGIADPGGNIMIHGLKNGWGWLGRCHRWVDWTAGCVAVTNAEMDFIWAAVLDGTPIELRP